MRGRLSFARRVPPAIVPPARGPSG
jgi:hypothetical protein